MKQYQRDEKQEEELKEAQESGAGARFDEGKARYDLISMVAINKLAEHYQEIPLNYGELKVGGLYNNALMFIRSFWSGDEYSEIHFGFHPLVWATRYFMDLLSLEFPELPELARSNHLPVSHLLIPTYSLNEVARVYTYGTIKYDDNNWRKGMKWGRIYGPIERHAAAWRMGETNDPESGLHHLAHSAWNCIALYEYVFTHPELDDRWIIKEQKK